MKRVYSAAELAELPPTARLGVVGNPIAHSLSPPMQQAALDADSRHLTYVRLLCGREEGDFPALVRALQQAGFVGVNVTVPFKKEAYALADESDALSRLCGAANTLVFHGRSISCFNTDGPGFSRAVQELCGRPLSELRVALLGACGGAGLALAAQCVLENCPRLVAINRPRPELARLAESLQAYARGTQVSTCTFDDARLPGIIRAADLVVNATSVGLAAGDPPPIAPEYLQAGQVVYDIVTHPTALTAAAAERGCLAATGQSMLLWQGALAYEHWFARLPEVALMSRALSAAAGA